MPKAHEMNDIENKNSYSSIRKLSKNVSKKSLKKKSSNKKSSNHKGKKKNTDSEMTAEFKAILNSDDKTSYKGLNNNLNQQNNNLNQQNNNLNQRNIDPLLVTDYVKTDSNGNMFNTNKIGTLLGGIAQLNTTSNYMPSSINNKINQPMDQLNNYQSGQSFGQPMDQLNNYQSGQSFGQPMDQSFGQPMDQSFGQPFGQPFAQPINQSFGQPFGQPMNQQFGQPMNQQFGQPMNQPFGQPMNQSFEQSFGQPMNQQGGSSNEFIRGLKNLSLLN